ncbi:MAG: hypothetical protein Q8Q56_03405, partial [Alphaproteobacteria bacterium]|nr:hypothetical protein [Alphaproteobacteria bacterium]
MVLRLLFASFILLGTINMSVYGSDDDNEDEFTVEDVTPEMLARTLPPHQNLDHDDEAAEPSETHDSAKQDSGTMAPANDVDLKLREVIRILETDSDRANLVETLKTLTQSNVLAPRQFMFLNIVEGIKDFLRSIVTE